MISIIDAHNALWKGVFGTWSDLPESVIVKVCQASKSINSSRIIFVFDGGNARRLALFRDYKAHRKIDETWKRQFDDLFPQFKSLIRSFGLESVEVAGEEADDVIFSIIKYNPGESFTIFSNDRDFYSLLSSRVSVYNWDKVITNIEFQNEYGILPREWILLKALMGDASDNYPGIHGIGLKKGLEVIKNGLFSNYESRPEVQLGLRLFSFYDVGEDNIKSNTIKGKLNSMIVRECLEKLKVSIELLDYLEGLNQEEDREELLKELENEMVNCKRCYLRKGSTNVVTWRGNKEAKILVIGEAPGRDEDKAGVPFIGRAGQKLQEWLETYDLSGKVLISNVVWCRPQNENGEDRTPNVNEVKVCSEIGINRLIDIIKPDMIICLGNTPSSFIMERKIQITKDYGKYVKIFNGKPVKVFLMPHPASVLYNDSLNSVAYKVLSMIRNDI